MLSVQTKINNNEKQKLTELRDWLLPMLMNGQVKVRNAEKIMAEEESKYKKMKF